MSSLRRAVRCAAPCSRRRSTAVAATACHHRFAHLPFFAIVTAPSCSHPRWPPFPAITDCADIVAAPLLSRAPTAVASRCLPPPPTHALLSLLFCWHGDCPFMSPPAIAAIPGHHRLRRHAAALLLARAPALHKHSCARALSPPPPPPDAGLAHRACVCRAKRRHTCPNNRI